MSQTIMEMEVAAAARAAGGPEPAKLEVAIADQNTQNPAPGTDPNAQPAPGAEPKPEDPKPEGEEDKEEGEEEKSTDPLAFWKEVDQIRGSELPVDYQGSDPNTPEGVIKRENTIMNLGYEAYEHALQEKFPQVYAFLLHSIKGGSTEDFLEVKIPTLPEHDMFKNDVDLQARIYRNHLLNSGLDAEDAEVAVKTAITKKVLFEKADAVYQKLQSDSQSQIARLEAATEQQEQEYKRGVDATKKLIGESIAGTGMRITIPETVRKEFATYVGEQIYSEGGKFFYQQEINKDTINDIMQGAYFSFKKGDINALVSRKAQTIFSGQIKANVANAQQSSKSTKDSKNFKPAAEM